MVIPGINSEDKNLVIEYEYGSIPSRLRIEWKAKVLERDALVEFEGLVTVTPRLNRKMRSWAQDKIDATVQRLIELSILKIAHYYSESGIYGYDVWLKSKQARFIGRPSQQMYTFARELDLHIYREAM